MAHESHIFGSGPPLDHPLLLCLFGWRFLHSVISVSLGELLADMGVSQESLLIITGRENVTVAFLAL